MYFEKELADLVGSLPLFSKTPPSVLCAWLKNANALQKTLSPGNDLGEFGEKHLGILLEGYADIQSADSGRSVVLRTMHAPSVFGAASLFCDSPLPLSNIPAKTVCRVLYVPLKDVNELLAKDEGFRTSYLAFLAGRVRFLNRKIQCFTAGSAERRLALWLLSEEEEIITLPSSLTTLSDMLDIGRASLYRALDKLENSGLISREGRNITLLSPDEILKKYQ